MPGREPGIPRDLRCDGGTPVTISVLHRAISKHWATFFATFRIHDLRQLERRRGTRAGGLALTRSAARGLLWGQTRWRNNGGLQTFSPSFFPKSHMFSSKLLPKESFWWFCGISTCYKGSKPKEPFSKFFVAPASVSALFRTPSTPHSADSAAAIRVCSAVRRVAGLRGRTFRPNLQFSFSESNDRARIRFQRKAKRREIEKRSTPAFQRNSSLERAAQKPLSLGGFRRCRSSCPQVSRCSS